MKATKEEVSESINIALAKITEILEKGNPDELFEKNNGDYYSKERFLVSWKGNYKGMWSEFRIDKVDAFYTSMSGIKAIYCAVGLFHEKQLKAYPTIERAFIDIGLMLTPKEDKEAFYNKYAIPYNEKLKAKQA